MTWFLLLWGVIMTAKNNWDDNFNLVVGALTDGGNYHAWGEPLLSERQKTVITNVLLNKFDMPVEG